jgi:hypothetical protein
MKFEVKITKDSDIKEIQRAIQEACDKAKADAVKAYEKLKADERAEQEKKKERDRRLLGRRIAVADAFVDYCNELGITPTIEDKCELRNIILDSLEEIEANMDSIKDLVKMMSSETKGEDCAEAPKIKTAIDIDDILADFLKSLE